MPNFYEILKIQPSASTTEVNTAVEARYNQARRLVTHHDPQIVNQANQAIILLEKIRTTLTDPIKRDSYDNGLGLKGPVGGLADPSLPLESLATRHNPTPPSIKNAPPQPKEASAEDLWGCYKCGSPNPPLSMSCFKCGAPLMRECPECHEKRSLIRTGMCGNCGYKYETARQRQNIRNQMMELNGRIGSFHQAIAHELNVPINSSSNTNTPGWFIIGGSGLFVFCGLSSGVSQLTTFMAFFFGLIGIALGVFILVMANRAVQKQKNNKEEKIRELGNHIETLESQIRSLQIELLRLQNY